MRFERVNTVLPLDDFIEYDGGLQGFLRTKHATAIGYLMFDRYGIEGGAREVGDDFIRGMTSVWVKSELPLFDRRESEALRNLEAATLMYAREESEENRKKVEGALSQFGLSLFWAAEEMVQEEENESESEGV